MRSKSSKVFAWLVVVILVIGLAGFGIQDVIRSSGNSYVAKFGKQKVSPEDYIRAIQQEINFLSSQLGKQIPFEQAKSFGITQRALQNLLSSMVFDQMADDFGVSRGDPSVINEIQNNRAFSNFGGKFDKEKYAAALERINLQPREYEEMIRKDLTRSLIYAVIKSEGAIPPQVVDLMTEYVLEERVAEIVSFKLEDLDLSLNEPSNIDIENFYQNNLDLFKNPPGRRVSYIYLTPQILAKQQVISEEEIDEEFFINGQAYNSPERRNIDQIFFLDKEATEKISASGIISSEKFENVVSERGLSNDDISLGEVTKFDLPIEAQEEVFSTRDIGVFGPYSSEVGYVLYRVNNIIPENILSEIEVRQLIQKDIALQKSETELVDVSAYVENEIAAGSTLEEIAKTSKMIFENVEIYPQKNLPFPMNIIEFRDAAEMADKYPSNLIITEDGTMFAVRLDEELDESIKKLETVTDEILERLKGIQSSTRLKDLGQNIISENAGKRLLNHDFNHSPHSKKEVKLSRFKVNSNLTSSTINSVFEMNEMDVTIEVSGNTLNLVQYIKTSDPSVTAVDSKNINKQISFDYTDSLNTDIINVMLNTFQKIHDMEVNQTAVNRTIASFE